ncbi:serine/threonine-protein kinase ATR-like protein [Trifolium pratense]|uniref:Serine/threonine-protein kinase ATR-like protein n=1 Tax=Trifolium pratense TaxID=57577 RepID=A0A2K3KNV6_TRIPR|nr:serine/threonine-protein kinase ATR-like protein [Trifolium pratense]
MARANLTSLLHELRERITSSSSSSTPNNATDDTDALELSFRAVLPNLLHSFVLPSSSGNLTYSLLHHHHHHYQFIIISID